MPSIKSIDDPKHWHDRAKEISSKERQDHLLFLDLIRWVSAFAVVAYHLRDLIFVPLAQPTAAPLWLRIFYFGTALGHEAVMVFFVLSGYLVGGALVSRPSLRLGAEYFIARFARIYPVVLPALAITVFVGLELPHWLAAAPILSGRHWGDSLGYDFRERLSLWTVACNSLMLQNTACMPLGDNGPLWSLSCEWFYYMSFPLALWLLRCRPRVPALAAMASLFAIVAWEFPAAAQYYPVWLFGVAARLVGDRLPMGRSSLFAFTLALAASLTIEYLNVVPQATGDMAVGAATAGMLSCRAVRSVRLGRLHGHLAGFSYSLYVVHFPIATALIGAWQQLAHVQHRSTPGPVAFLVFSGTLLGCYLAAFAIAQFTERRAGDFRRALSGILVSLQSSESSSLVADSGRSSAVVERIKLKSKFSPSATIVCLLCRVYDLSRTIPMGINESVSPETDNEALPPAKVLSRQPSHHRPRGTEPV